jgi:hypothetical protein
MLEGQLRWKEGMEEEIIHSTDILGMVTTRHTVLM